MLLKQNSNYTLMRGKQEISTSKPSEFKQSDKTINECTMTKSVFKSYSGPNLGVIQTRDELTLTNTEFCVKRALEVSASVCWARWAFIATLSLPDWWRHAVFLRTNQLPGNLPGTRGHACGRGSPRIHTHKHSPAGGDTQGQRSEGHNIS